MTGAIIKLTNPSGEFFYHGRDSETSDRSKAFVYVSAAVARGAAIDIIHGNRFAFWECERESARRTRERMRGWKAEIEAA